MFYKGESRIPVPGIQRCLPCDRGCKKGLIPCVAMCGSGCGCPEGLVKSPTAENKCIKPEECPTGSNLPKFLVPSKVCKFFPLK